MGQPQLADAGCYQTVRSRIADEDNVNRIVQDWAGGLQQDEVRSACNAGEVPCGAIMSIEDIMQDPQYAARKTLLDMMVEGVGELPFPAPLPRLSETPGQLNSLGPKLGNANASIYKVLLGLSETELHQLQKDGVI
ncbi:MAG TPA: carnitine dehydratase, partial [Rhodobacteraceae bacterium]|nr:carnitine dehydratase [Paracoccaceae bacterium]